ncbi:MAG: GNAT family N-acetyltransferase [Chloroflexi bacterium]|nr:GNAT family N-acetyltransferase [Chloroflexota bacterium]OJV89742.1 MAG: hypothetical protein BGO39_28775 [Chloroflexi bacterium 54-19]
MTDSFSDYTIRPVAVTEWDKLHFIWEASQDIDDPAGRPPEGWWSLGDWTKTGLVLSKDTQPIGLAAFKPTREPDAIEVRLALLPGYRQPEAVTHLVEGVFDEARHMGFNSVRFFFSGGGAWATEIVAGFGIEPLRKYHSMLLPAAVEVPLFPVPEGMRIRPLAEGEDEAALAALNKAWATTWNFRPIPMKALQKDLDGQRTGFLVAVPLSAETHVIGTCHAILDPHNYNHDGGIYALISNLTNDPDWRGRGLGRALLTAGIHHLRARGATSVRLGVDGGNPVPMALYHSIGFKSISSVEVWTGQIPELL